MKFTAAQVSAFCAASHDRNPLHIDPDYARRSQFGKPVVYGLAAVLHALGVWAAGRTFRLQQLRAVFRKPLFEGEEYAVAVQESGSDVIVKFQKGPVDYAVVSFSATEMATHALEYAQLHTPFEPKPSPADAPEAAAHSQRYRMNAEAWPQLAEAFDLHPQAMPMHQSAALLWASYHVGMILPGRQALFSELQMTFTDEYVHSVEIVLELDAADFDERFNRYVLNGRGTGIDSLRIAAFRRPLPVDFPLSAMPAFAEGYLPLQGKVVFISGATRGFGAAMARMAARAGAMLALNYRGDASAADALRTELQAYGAEVEAYAADMADPAAVAQMATAISGRFGNIDLIVNNAAPPIRDLQFLEQDNLHIAQFVQQNLAITLETARHLLPLLSKGGQFLHVSTKYLVEPVRGFAHYLTAKAAQEALVQALSLESRDHEFIVVRLPRILTDQTNLAFDFDPPLHPGEVAREAILSLVDSKQDGNYRVVNLFGVADAV